jgi:CubicO group peptidase (beta-lactamase class C family)
LDDPVAKYLPAEVKLPTHNGKEITLLNLAAQDSGLPFNADNHTGADWAERFATYTVPRMYDFLSRYQLTQAPGEKFQYSNIGMGLLGHVLARNAGSDFESLVKERICRPLDMQSTGIKLSPELAARFAVGYDEAGKRAASFDLPAIPGAGALRSTANDLAKYVGAEIGIGPPAMTAMMQKSHAVQHHDAQVRDAFAGVSALPWFDEGVWCPSGSKLLGHGGGTGGYNSFVGFDLLKRRGVVVLTNQSRIHSSMLGWRILQRARLEGLDAEKMVPVREMIGAGITLESDATNGAIRITRIFPNSPAAAAGLTSGLVVKSINDIVAAGKSITECLQILRGPLGSKLRLELNDPQGKTTTVELVRQKFRIES